MARRWRREHAGGGPPASISLIAAVSWQTSARRRREAHSAPRPHGLPLSQSLPFKARKALRYVRLYGPSRTIVKVRSQRHMAKTYDRLPALPVSRGGDIHVGIVGCGKFAYAQIAYYLTREFGHVIRAAMDADFARAAFAVRTLPPRLFHR